MIGIVYEHKNKLNGKRYIGRTIQSMKARMREGYYNTKFANALNKYGWENFETTVLWELESDNKEDLLHSLNIIEEIIIMSENLQDDKFGYNVKAGGFNGTFKHTPEAIEKIRLSSKRPNAGQFKKGATPWIKGRKVVQTEEHRLKVGLGLKAAYANGTRQAWNKGVIGTNKPGRKVKSLNTGVVYMSLSQASNSGKDCLNTIHRHCNNKSKKPRWKYV